MASETSACDGGLAARESEIDVDSTRLSYLEWGTHGRPVVLLHGITSSARTWWRVAPTLVSHGYHVFAFDMPGHGSSDEARDHRIDAIADVIAAAIGKLGLEGAALIGHSWGGATALALASGSRQGLLERVVLIDPALQMSPERGLAVLPNYTMGIGQSREETQPTLRAANPDWQECDVYWKSIALEQCRFGAVRGLFTQSGTWDFAARPGDVDIPLLLLAADPRYTVIAPEVLKTAEQALRPNLGRAVVVPGTNHNMFRGGYNLIMPLLLDWLSDANNQ